MNTETTLKDLNNTVHTYIVEILKDKFGVHIHDSQNFFGAHGILNSRELVYLVFFLEKKFNVLFTPEDMDKETFYMIDGMVDMIIEKILHEKDVKEYSQVFFT